MESRSRPTLVELRPEELVRTAAAGGGPLSPPDPIICYWPTRRALVNRFSASPLLRGSGASRS
jgi:hypothetical protein